MGNSFKYSVAGHSFRFVLPESLPSCSWLSPYEPFRCEEAGESIFTLRLECVSSLADVVGGELVERFNDEAPYLWVFRKENRYIFAFSYTVDHPDCVLVASADFSDAVIYIDKVKYAEFAMSNAAMLLYAFRTLPHDTLLAHASVVKYDGCGYIFLGRSGTGKSTHSRLWLESIEGTSLLNDDNPVIRIIDGEVRVFGSPWSGKTHCYINEELPLQAVVRLSQAPYNKIGRLGMLQSYASLMPACSCARWDRASVDYLHKTVEKVIGKVGCWHLDCLPDHEAARLCCDTVKR